MRLIGENFSRNGHLVFKGVVKAEKDDGTLTDWADTVNVYSRREKLKLVENLANDLLVSLDEARSMVADFVIRLESQIKEAEALPDADDDEGKKSQSTLLVEMADAWEYWHTPDGRPFATLAVEDHREHWPIFSKYFRQCLAYQFYQLQGKTPGTQGIYDALSVLAGKAVFSGPEYEAYVRVAAVGNEVYLDLGNPSWDVVKVTAAGWEVLADPPVRFRRPRGMLPLPAPHRRGDIGELRSLLNLATDEDWALYLGCLVQALRGQGPYPILVINGEHGSAKSSATTAFRDLIDPREAGLRTIPRDERDLMIHASNSCVLAFDNLSWLPRWLPDALCRLSTGGGMGTRELWSDDEEVLFKGRRPIVVNGIEELVTAPDLADRAVTLTLPEIPEDRRMSEKQFLGEFKEMHGVILGGLLDALVVGLRNEGNFHLERLPRMADFALFVSAAEPGLGLEPGTFLSAYSQNREGANESTLEASPLVPHLIKFSEANPCWEGRASELLSALETLAEERERKLDSWPKQPNVLSNQLRNLAPNLRMAGIAVQFQGRKNKHRKLVIQNNMQKDRATVTHRHPEREAVLVEGDDPSAGSAGAPAETVTHRPETRRDRHPFRAQGDDGDGGDDVFADYSKWGGETFCVGCGQPTDVTEIARYLDESGKVVCVECHLDEE